MNEEAIEIYLLVRKIGLSRNYIQS